MPLSATSVKGAATRSRKSERPWTFDKLHDKGMTIKEGLTGSVMDYVPVNLALPGAHQGEYYQTTLGPYDYWAIEYAYKPVEAATPEEELPELRKIAARVSDPMVAYSTDEDAGFSPEPWDMDPHVNRWDLGSDPLRFYAHRVKLSEEIWENLEATLEKRGEGYQVLRRSFENALFRATIALRLAAKYLGGVYHPRDHVDDPGDRLPFAPVPRGRQEEALELLREHLFSPRAFQFPPRLLNKLASERWPEWRDFQSMQRRYDYPVHAQVLAEQRAVLDRLYHPIVLARLLDAEVKDPDPFTISALFTGLQEAIWEETKAPKGSIAINSYRRSLQREHLKRLAGLLLAGQGEPPEDARTMARRGLESLRGQLRASLTKPGLTMPLETRAHLDESLGRIEQALKASAQRTAF